MASGDSLRLLALDADDLAVISAALQDGVTHIGDIRWEKAHHRLTIVFNRLRWEAEDGPHERVRSAIQLGCVVAVKARNVRPEPKDAVLQLLAITFEEGDCPAGVVRFAFADGADLAAEVECVDAALADLSAPWTTTHRPAHGG
ncbi:MAG: DUF2948 family protein [Caulobacteraceae bacterium]|nr:DUF2948 family protein [Caulobacteraceae bacterium]